MDYSNKLLLRDYLNKMDKEYHQQVITSKQYKLLLSCLATNPILELYDFPELFTSQEEYEQYYDGDLYENTLEEKDSDKLEQLLYAMLFSQYGYFPLRPTVQPYFEENYLYDQTRHDLAEHQAANLRQFVDNQKQIWTNTIDRTYNTQTIRETVQQQQSKLQQLLEMQARQKDNALKHTIEISKPEKQQKKYKQWIWTPNPHTRHHYMADTIVQINEPFHVISSQSHCPDCYMQYPLDITAPICQIAYCKCFHIYTDKKDGI